MFLHTFYPQPILLSFGSLTIYWYGLFIVLGTIVALTVSMQIAKKRGFSTNKLFDLSFWLIFFGILGARLYHVFLEFPYYLKNPLNIFKIWQGGLAIHGALIAGLIVLFIFCRKEKISIWFLSGLIVPGIALGQTIGRWGNYFNQELFGKPTNLPWGIPIDPINRPLNYLFSDYFHPAFLYESLGNLIIFSILLFLTFQVANKKIKNEKNILLSYFILYSILRFFMEFLRLDQTLFIYGLRWPQIFSLIIFIVAITILFTPLIYKKKVDKIKQD